MKLFFSFVKLIFRVFHTVNNVWYCTAKSIRLSCTTLELEVSKIVTNFYCWKLPIACFCCHKKANTKRETHNELSKCRIAEKKKSLDGNERRNDFKNIIFAKVLLHFLFFHDAVLIKFHSRIRKKKSYPLFSLNLHVYHPMFLSSLPFEMEISYFV